MNRERNPLLVPLTDEYKKRITARAVPGSFYDDQSRTWVFDASDDRAALIAIRLFPHVKDLLPAEQLERLGTIGMLDRFDAASPWASQYKPEELLPGVPQELRDKLYPYQLTDLGYAAARMRADGGAYLAWDRGLGKTLGAITLAYELNVQRVLIVTPSQSKQSVWAPEFAKWDIEGRFTDRIYDIGNSEVKRARATRAFIEDGGVLLCHYEALRLLDVRRIVADLVIVDEAHRLAAGGPGSRAPQFYRSLKRVRSDYRLALSGSVIINSPEDFFGANHWLFPDTYKSRWRDWNNRYLDYVDSGFGKVLIGVKPERLEDLKQELSAYMCVRSKQDELPGLPERVVQYMYVELSPAQRRVYDDLAESFLASLPDGTQITTGTVLGQLTKLRQITTGLSLISNDRHPKNPHSDSSKLDLAQQLCEDNLPNKTVVFCWHRAACDELAERLEKRGVPTAVVHGDIPHKRRTEIVSAFQQSDDPKVLVATIKTLGESVTLHAAADVIFVESSWTAADMEQAADRVYRIGQNRRVTITHIVAKDTVDDQQVMPAVATKAELRRMILGGTSG